jgi:hypothetical protein
MRSARAERGPRAADGLRRSFRASWRIAAPVVAGRETRPDSSPSQPRTRRWYRCRRPARPGQATRLEREPGERGPASSSRWARSTTRGWFDCEQLLPSLAASSRVTQTASSRVAHWTSQSVSGVCQTCVPRRSAAAEHQLAAIGTQAPCRVGEPTVPSHQAAVCRPDGLAPPSRRRRRHAPVSSGRGWPSGACRRRRG